MQSHEDFLEGRQLRRMKYEDRYLAKLEKQEAAAEKLVGELVRDGKTIFYINQLARNGAPTGRTREFTGYSQAVDFLVRNGYV